MVEGGDYDEIILSTAPAVSDFLPDWTPQALSPGFGNY